jgi:hypothetical protein
MALLGNAARRTPREPAMPKDHDFKRLVHARTDHGRAVLGGTRRREPSSASIMKDAPDPAGI